MALVIALAGVVLAITPNPQSAALSRQAANRQVTAQARHVVPARHKLAAPHRRRPRRSPAPCRQPFPSWAKRGLPWRRWWPCPPSLAGWPSWTTLGEVNQAAHAAAGDALAGAPGAQHVASALASGNLKAAAANLRSLAGRLSTLSQSQRRALAAALSKAAAAAGYQAKTGRGASGQSASN